MIRVARTFLSEPPAGDVGVVRLRPVLSWQKLPAREPSASNPERSGGPVSLGSDYSEGDAIPGLMWRGRPRPRYSVSVARVLISGASGLIGRALVSALESRSDQVYRLVRREPRTEREIRWDPMQAVPPQLVSDFAAVIHLSGESVSGRWTKAKKQRIRDSRIVSTENLSNALA